MYDKIARDGYLNVLEKIYLFILKSLRDKYRLRKLQIEIATDVMRWKRKKKLRRNTERTRRHPKNAEGVNLSAVPINRVS